MIKTFKDLKLSSRYAPSLRASWKEGLGASVMLNVTDYYLIPLGLVLGASPFQIGLLVAVPHLLGAFAQLLSSHLVRWIGSRLGFLIKGVTIQALLLLPVALLPLVSFKFRVETFILLVVGFRILGNLIGTVWGSLVSDYLSPEERGKYLGWRAQLAAISGVLGVILGGLLLWFIERWSPEAGFFLLMILTAASRFFSAFYMRGMEDIPLSNTGGSDFTFFQFLMRFKESNFVKFVLYVACITFAAHMAAPYFSVYMLDELGFGYLSYMAVHLSAVIAGLVSFPIWGYHADHAGNAKVLKVTSFFIPAIPFLWLFTNSVLGLILIEFFAGFVWGGFNLCSVNYIFDAVSAEKRVRCLSYFNFINGLAIFGGATLGGFLATSLPAIAGSKFLTLFLISTLLRLLAHFLLSKNFREVRSSARPVKSADLLFSVVGVKPLIGRNRELNFLPIKD